MTYYGYVLICTARFARHFKTERGAHSLSLWYTGFCQILVLAAGFKILDTLYPVRFHSDYMSYIFVIGMIAWFVGLSEYYTLSRVEKLSTMFDEKNLQAQRAWNIITIASVVVPISILFLLFSDHK